MSGLIAQGFIDELLQVTDIVELIDSFISLKKAGTSYVACCPFHNEKTPSFNVITKKQFYHCFGCNASGNAISFIMNYMHIGFREAVELLANRQGLEIPELNSTGSARNHKEKLSLYQLLNQVNNYYQKQLRQHPQAIEYLKNRNLTGKTAKFFQLGFAKDNWHGLEKEFAKYKEDLLTSGMLIKSDKGSIYDRYRNRIMFPIHDKSGRIIGFGGRVIDKGQKPKYLNSPETIIFQKSRELYGLYQIIKNNPNPEAIIIVEGYMDVIALFQHGINNAVATLGTATSSAHIKLLLRHSKKLIFCFDGDLAGRNAAKTAMETCFLELNQGVEIKFMFITEGEDPDSLVSKIGKEKFVKLLDKAMAIDEFFFHTITQNNNKQTIDGRTRILNNASSYITKMPEGAYKQLLLEKLAQITKLLPHQINKLTQSEDSQGRISSTYKNLTIERSPLKIATALILQHPQIYADSKVTIDPQILDYPELKILKTIITELNQNPQRTTGSLLELWRDTQLFDTINSLAGWNHQVPLDSLAKEFFEILLFLVKKHQDSKIDIMLEKSKKSGLSCNERIMLQELLKKRHKSIDKELN